MTDEELIMLKEKGDEITLNQKIREEFVEKIINSKLCNGEWVLERLVPQEYQKFKLKKRNDILDDLI